jgi:hypothetical protein
MVSMESNAYNSYVILSFDGEQRLQLLPYSTISMESKAYNSYVILQFRWRVKPTTPTLFQSFDGE